MRVLLIEDLKRVQVMFSYCKIKDFDQLVTIVKSIDGWKFEIASKTWSIPKQSIEDLIDKFSKINIKTTVFKKQDDNIEKAKLIKEDDATKLFDVSIEKGLKRKKVFDEASNNMLLLDVVKTSDSFLIKLPIDPMAYYSLKRYDFLVWEDSNTWKVEKQHHEEFLKACDTNFIEMKFI